MKITDRSQLNPKDILTPDRFMEYERSVIGSERVTCALELINRNGLNVLDIGGASGVFLNELDTRSEYKSNLFNLEVDDTYRDRQINRNIRFVRGSVIDSRLEDNFFDVVTLRHILHHLVGNDLRTTKANQEKAFEEVFRITKSGGYVLIEEEVNRIKLFSRTVYLLSKLANRYKIRSKTFDAGTVIVSFMTPREIHEVIEKRRQDFGLEVLRTDYVPWHMPLQWKLTLLMSKVGHVFWLLKKT